MGGYKQVLYSFEHGDETLPHLKDLVSEVQDPEKSRILSYLRLHCILACPGIIHDEINSDKVIGCGNIFSNYYVPDPGKKEYLQKQALETV